MAAGGTGREVEAAVAVPGHPVSIAPVLEVGPLVQQGLHDLLLAIRAGDPRGGHPDLGNPVDAAAAARLPAGQRLPEAGHVARRHRVDPPVVVRREAAAAAAAAAAAPERGVELLELGARHAPNKDSTAYL